MGWLRFILRSAFWTLILNWIIRKPAAGDSDVNRFNFRHQTRQMGVTLSDFLRRRMSR
jgi:hypothetical protein